MFYCLLFPQWGREKCQWRNPVCDRNGNWRHYSFISSVSRNFFQNEPFSFSTSVCLFSYILSPLMREILMDPRVFPIHKHCYFCIMTSDWCLWHSLNSFWHKEWAGTELVIGMADQTQPLPWGTCWENLGSCLFWSTDGTWVRFRNWVNSAASLHYHGLFIILSSAISYLLNQLQGKISLLAALVSQWKEDELENNIGIV